MAKQITETDYDVAQVVARIRHARDRILQAVKWARSTKEVWMAFNNARFPRDLSGTSVEEAVVVYQRATLEGVILRVSRVLDRPSHQGILHTNRISLPICRDLIALPGVLYRFADDARGEENAALVYDRFENLKRRLHTLETEEPNKQRLVRDFRDENIAHELKLNPLPQRPQYRQVWELLDEVTSATEDLAMIANGQAFHWAQEEAGRAATLLWEAVSAGHPPLMA